MSEDDARNIVDIPLIEEMIAATEKETGRLEKFTDRVLSKLSAVITISGILTFVSFGFLSNANQTAFLPFYMVWILPYLVIGIILWVFVFKNSPAIIAKEDFFMKSVDSKVTLQYVQAKLEMHQGIYHSTHDIYQVTRKLFAYSLSFILAYLVLYVLCFYFYVFGSLLDISHMILVTIIMLLLIFIFRYWYSSGKVVVEIVKDIKIPFINPKPKEESSPDKE